MKAKQLILLSIALIFPVAIFLFLKGFGKNEFHVAPMFADSLPDVVLECPDRATTPYVIPAVELDKLNIRTDSLSCIQFTGEVTSDELARVREEYKGDPLNILQMKASENQMQKKCVFLLVEPFDVVLVDNKGRIRGQYNSSKRDEIDRLITEIAIIFKKY